ncbi:MAG: hypothetical protein IKK74_10900 [Clostridia bacterium]|nr:hypothetical protein [Clostridia bacterium]
MVSKKAAPNILDINSSPQENQAVADSKTRLRWGVMVVFTSKMTELSFVSFTNLGDFEYFGRKRANFCNKTLS